MNVQCHFLHPYVFSYYWDILNFKRIHVFGFFNLVPSEISGNLLTYTVFKVTKINFVLYWGLYNFKNLNICRSLLESSSVRFYKSETHSVSFRTRVQIEKNRLFRRRKPSQSRGADNSLLTIPSYVIGRFVRIATERTVKTYY